MKRIFTDKGWEHYLYWQSTDKQMLKKINVLIKDIERSPYAGIGKPEPLKHDWSGFWSRRIDEEHRLIYRIGGDGDALELVAMRYHYGDR